MAVIVVQHARGFQFAETFAGDRLQSAARTDALDDGALLGARGSAATALWGEEAATRSPGARRSKVLKV